MGIFEILVSFKTNTNTHDSDVDLAAIAVIKVKMFVSPFIRSSTNLLYLSIISLHVQIGQCWICFYSCCFGTKDVVIDFNGISNLTSAA